MSLTKANVGLAIKIQRDIDKLSKSSEYRRWSTLLKAIFTGHKGANGNTTVWQHVIENTGNENPVPANNCEISQAFARLIIEQTIDLKTSALLLEIPENEPNWALTAWNLLKEHYQSDMAANRQRLIMRINNTRLEQFRKSEKTEGEAMEDYIAQLQHLRAELNLAQGNMKEQDLTRIIRTNLPNEYAQAVISLSTLDANQDTVKRTSTFLAGIAPLIKKNSQFDGRNDALTAATYDQPRGRRRPYRGRPYRGRGRGRKYFNQRNRRNFQEDQRRQRIDTQICYDHLKGKCTRKNCRYTHVTRDSIVKAYNGLQREHGNEANVATQHDDEELDFQSLENALMMAHQDEEPINNILLTMKERKHNFICDTGATCHYLPPSYSKFIINPSTVREKVRLAVGTTHGNLRGDLPVLFFKDPQPSRNTFACTLKNALIVPTLKQPLLSVSSLTANSEIINFHFENNSVQGFKDDERCIYGERTKTLYTVPFMIDENAANVANQEERLKPHHHSGLPDAGVLHLHRTYGHASTATLKTMIKTGRIQVDTGLRDALKNGINISEICNDCAKAKSTRKPITKESTPPLQKGDGIWNVDLKGPLTKSQGNNQYVLMCVHARSGLDKAYFIKSKDQAIDKLELLRVEARRDGHAIEILRFDNGREFDNDRIIEWMKENSIQAQRTSPESSAQNGMVERRIRLHAENTTAALSHSGLPASYWPEAWSTSVYTRNRMPSSTRQRKIPFEIYHGKRADLSRIQPFGCAAYARLPTPLYTKRNFSGRARKCVLLNYEDDSKDGYKLLNLETRRVIHSRSVKFIRTEFPFKNKTTYNNESNEEVTTLEKENIASTDNDKTIRNPLPSAKAPTEKHRPESSKESTIPSRKSNRISAKPFTFSPHDYDTANKHKRSKNIVKLISNSLMLTEIEEAEPTSLKEALASKDKKQWIQAIKAELKSHKINQTWRYSRLPKGRSAIGCRYVFKRKRGPDGKITKYKVRLVAKGFAQRPQLDFIDTFSPTPRMSTIRLILAMAAHKKLSLHQLDVNTAYLIPKLPKTETVFMEPPPGMAGVPNEHVLQLQKCIYGLKQSGRHWNQHLHKSLQEMEFLQSTVDPCLYINKDKDAAIVIYVDDIIIAANDETMDKVKTQLQKYYPIKDLGQLSWHLGCLIQYDKAARRISISQSALCDTIISRAGMEGCKPAPTPIVERLYEVDDTLTQEESILIKKVPYRESLGALLFLSRCTRPDITFAVNQLSRFADKYREKHWKAMKRCLRYLQGTKNFGICFTGEKEFKLLGFSDADWAGDRTTRKSTTGFCFTIAGALISWRSQTQRCVALSTAESELEALTTTVKEAAWLSRLSKCLGFNQAPLTIHEDNQAAIVLVKDHKFSERTKHMDVRYFYVREKISDGTIIVNYVPTKDQLADIFTKPLSKVMFCELRKRIGVVNIN